MSGNLAHRRRTLAQLAGANIMREAMRIAAERGLSEGDAVAAVFADQDLLDKCFRIAGAMVPDQPKSSIDVQNREPR